MTLEYLRTFCLSLPHTTEDVKWGHDLCFSIGGKMFCVVSMEDSLKVSLKVSEGEFDELINLPGIKPAPYVARYHWIWIEDETVFTRPKWERYIKQSYDLVFSKLPKKILAGLR
jgi:predicted DNA-binding protein (MmcQ/YjbR family)